MAGKSVLLLVELNNRGANFVSTVSLYKNQKIKSIILSSNVTTLQSINIKFDSTKTNTNNPYVKSSTGNYSIDQLNFYYYQFGSNQIIFHEPKNCDLFIITNIDAIGVSAYVYVTFEILI